MCFRDLKLCYCRFYCLISFLFSPTIVYPLCFEGRNGTQAVFCETRNEIVNTTKRCCRKMIFKGQNA